MNFFETDHNLGFSDQVNINDFEKIVEQFENPLLRYILRISSFSHEEAEEILQEVFIKAWKNLNSFDRDQKFSSWIYRIAHNETISAFRKEQSRGHENKIEWDEEMMGNLPGKIDISEEVQKKMNAAILQKLLLLLSQKYREILVLRYLEEKNYDEISDILHIPLGTVATLVNRAKKELKRIAQNHHFFQENL